MEINQVNQLMAIYADRFPMESVETVKNKLLNMDYNTATMRMAQLKNPTTAFILSIIFTIGIDRFYIGDVGMGVGKLLTCGGLWIWWFIDIFQIKDATKRKNMQMIMMM